MTEVSGPLLLNLLIFLSSTFFFAIVAKKFKVSPVIGYIVSGLFLGTLAGVGLVIGAEFLDKSFIDVEDAKNFLGVPLLGAISKINTTDSIRMEHEKERWLYSATVAIGVIVVVVTAAVTSFLK